MPDIGAMLRETRMRERIDITDVESATKIRAKYLRALENEEWDLLPGPTFVKTFLRTYGDYLGLDSKLLVEEYKQRFERPAPADLMPFAGRTTPGRRGQQRRMPSPPPWMVVGLVVLGLGGVLALLGSLGENPEDSARDVVTAPAARPTPAATNSRPGRNKPAATPTRVRLQLLPQGLVNVCLLDNSGKRLLDSVDLRAGEETRVFNSRRFRVAFGNGAIRMRVGNRIYGVPDRANPIGFDIRPGGKRPRELPAAARPVCS